LRQSPFPYAKASDHVCMKNGKVRKALTAHGDDGSAVRHVLHFLVRHDGATCSESEMAELLRPHGFTVDLSKYEGGVIAEEYREVASDDFDSLTQTLADMATARGWEYDGFECAVEVAPEPAPAERGSRGFSFKRLFAG